MKAGFARLDITPPFGTELVGYPHERPAESIITPLYVNAIAIDDGNTRAALVTIDAEGAVSECTDIMREYVSEKTGLDPDSVFISCTHCHQGTGFYVMSNVFQMVKTRVADAVKMALDDLKEAKAHIASGKAEGIAFIRLFKIKGGGSKSIPSLSNPNEIEGPMGTPDETVQLVKLTREGAPDIAIVQFQTHPDVIMSDSTKQRAICHDWPGYVRTFLEQALEDAADGKGVKAICFNGTQGDTNHINYSRITEGIIIRRGGVNHSKHMARVIVGEVLKMYTYADEVASDKVLFKKHPVTVNVTKKPVDAPDTRTLHLSSVVFGDVAFVGFPGEPFTEIGRQTKANSPFKMTFPCCMTNGQEGYFPMKEVFGSVKGYEASSTKFAVGTAERLIDAAIELTKELYSEEQEN